MEFSTMKCEDETEAFFGRMMKSLEQIGGKASGKVLLSDRSLLVSIHQLRYPVTEALLHQTFALYGNVEKILVLQEGGSGFRALVRFDSIIQSILAKQALHGQNIYEGCCVLDVQFPSEEIVRLAEYSETIEADLCGEVCILETSNCFDSKEQREEKLFVDTSVEINDEIDHGVCEVKYMNFEQEMIISREATVLLGNNEKFAAKCGDLSVEVDFNCKSYLTSLDEGIDEEMGGVQELVPVNFGVKGNFGAYEVLGKMSRKQNKKYAFLVGIAVMGLSEVLEMNLEFGLLARTSLTDLCMNVEQIDFALYVFNKNLEMPNCSKIHITFDPGGAASSLDDVAQLHLLCIHALELSFLPEMHLNNPRFKRKEIVKLGNKVEVYFMVAEFLKKLFLHSKDIKLCSS